MKTKIAIGTLLVCTTAAIAQGQQPNTPPPNYYDRESWLNSSSDQLFRANEFSVDIFGAGAGNTEHRDHDFGFNNNNHHRDLRGGGGGGMEYFFVRYIGIEAETMALANGHHTESSLGGNLMLRLPIADTGFAPYIFGGGGDLFTERTEAYADGGVGLEYRFTHRFGIFGDGRFVTPEHTRDYGLGRFGVRFTF